MKDQIEDDKTLSLFFLKFLIFHFFPSAPLVVLIEEVSSSSFLKSWFQGKEEFWQQALSIEWTAKTRKCNTRIDDIGLCLLLFILNTELRSRIIYHFWGRIHNHQ